MAGVMFFIATRIHAETGSTTDSEPMLYSKKSLSYYC